MHKVRTLLTIALLTTSSMSTSISAPADAHQTATTEDEYIREKIREVIGDDPLLEAIAGCESTGNPKTIVHTAEDGTLLKHSTLQSSAAGSFQILLKLHKPEIKRQKLNMQDIDNYMKFVGYLKDTQGYGAWSASRNCWKKYA